MNLIQEWRGRARRLKREVVALYLVCRDPRLPWYTRALALCVVGYALSPIDLIPDWIPVLGYLDDLLLVPLGIALVIKLTPDEILLESRRAAEAAEMAKKPVNWIAGGIIIALWGLGAALTILWLLRRLR